MTSVPETHGADWVEVDVDAVDPADPRSIIGLLALAEDRAVDQEMRTFLGPGLAIHTSRVPMPESLTLAGFRQMTEAFRTGARSLSGSCEVIAIGCASATIALGPGEITEVVGSVHPDAAVVDPVTACLDGLAAATAERVGLLTPYAKETNDALVELLRQQGVEVATGIRLNLPRRSLPAHVPSATIQAAITEADPAGAEAFVIFCTALHTASLLDDLTDRLGVPVISTNRALATAAKAKARNWP